MENQIQKVRESSVELESLMKLHAKPEIVPALVEQEIGYLQEHLYFTPALRECEPETMIFAIKSVIRKGLTLDPEAGLCYLTTRKVQVANNKWVKALKVTPSVNGLISMQRMAGRILDVKVNDPVTNDEGEFEECTVELLMPTADGKNEWRSFTTTKDDIKRLRKFSHRERSRKKPDANQKDYSNALYRGGKNGTVDLEFARTKAVKQAINRAKTGMNANEQIIQRDLTYDRILDLDPETEKHEATDFYEEQEVEVIDDKEPEKEREPEIDTEIDDNDDFMNEL